MKVNPIHNLGYDSRGNMLLNRKPLPVKKKRLTKPVDAVIVDDADFSGKQKEDYSWLADYIKNLPDSIVNERIKKFHHSFENIEDCLVQKLIIEEI